MEHLTMCRYINPYLVYSMLGNPVIGKIYFLMGSLLFRGELGESSIGMSLFGLNVQCMSLMLSHLVLNSPFRYSPNTYPLGAETESPPMFMGSPLSSYELCYLLSAWTLCLVMLAKQSYMKCIEQKSWDVRIMWCFKSGDRVSLFYGSHALLLEKVEGSWVLWAVNGRVHAHSVWDGTVWSRWWEMFSLGRDHARKRSGMWSNCTLFTERLLINIPCLPRRATMLLPS